MTQTLEAMEGLPRTEGLLSPSAVIRRAATISVAMALLVAWTLLTMQLTGGAALWRAEVEMRVHLALNLGCILAAITHAGFVRGLLDERIKRASLFVLALFGLYALAIIMGRLYFSRPMLASCLAQALTICVIVVLMRRREAPDRVAVIAPGQDHGLSVPGAVLVDDPSADLRAFDTVLVSPAEMADSRWARTLSRAMLAGARVRHMGEFVEDSSGSVSLRHFDLEDVSTAGIASYKSLKRAVDIALVLCLLPVALPLGLLAAAAILITGRGQPVFFLQERVGLAARPFTMWKLRTMRPEREGGELRAAVAGDSRITAVGGLLRRFRIDELPQLWNVLKGEMSLIGPRPEATALHAVYMEQIPNYTYRYLVRPGITGWAQVRCPPSATADEARTKLTFDLYYVKHVSPLLDLKIIVKTIWTLIEGGGVR